MTAGESDSAFLEEKVEEFKQFIFTRAKIVPYKTRQRSDGKRSTVLRFRVSTNKLRPVYNLLYPIGERQITQTTLNLLGAQAAAWLWAESVKIHKKGTALLSRVGCTQEEAQMISSWLQMLTGATSKLDETYTRPRILFDKEQTLKIQEGLIDYAPKSRKHLFLQEDWNVSSIRSARTELHLGKGEHQSERTEEATLAGNCKI
tara:strand:+ start:485 stop:1093 length:609 start_codon:yes stop_codon:yes gene_type:complete